MEWRRGLAALEEAYDARLTPYEKSPHLWRQARLSDLPFPARSSLRHADTRSLHSFGCTGLSVCLARQTGRPDKILGFCRWTCRQTDRPKKCKLLAYPVGAPVYPSIYLSICVSG